MGHLVLVERDQRPLHDRAGAARPADVDVDGDGHLRRSARRPSNHSGPRAGAGMAAKSMRVSSGTMHWRCPERPPP